jgi:multiple sugar transport system ATP-binding protein
MATVTLNGITKTFPNGFQAVAPSDLEVADGEFMVLVGPSGCGKTTMLRMVAGLEEPTAGDLWIGDDVVTHLSPKQRDIAMVFQNYALYPHMTVRQNIGFGLKLRKMPKGDREARVQEITRVLGLEEWVDSKPGQLSGGQRQRVAMGRAIVREPAVFLMDEPLSNLDAQLRVQMRAEVCRIQQQLGVTTMYVTHDQVEAMTMGDRVAVMRAGSVQQCDAPQHVYEHPANLFVAAFIGSPPMNLYEAIVGDDTRSVTVGDQELALTDTAVTARPGLRSYAGRAVVFGLRPEDLTVGADSGGATLEGEVDLVEALGSESLVHFSLAARRVGIEGVVSATDDQLATRGAGVARVDARCKPRVGERIRLSVDAERAHFFDPDTGLAI